MFQKKELRLLAGTILLLGLVFGFNDGSERFVLNAWVKHFVLVTIMAGIALLVHEIGHKLVAWRKDVTTEYTLWTIKRLSTKKPLRYGIPIGILLAILATLFTNGMFYYTAIGSTTTLVDEKKRLGRKYQALTEYEEALILLAGPVANVLFVLALHAISRATMIDLSNFITINLVFAAWQMLPLPGLDGAKIFFGSKNIYIFGLIFLVAAFALRNIGLAASIILSILTAFGILILYYYKYEQ